MFERSCGLQISTGLLHNIKDNGRINKQRNQRVAVDVTKNKNGYFLSELCLWTTDSVLPVYVDSNHLNFQSTITCGF